MISSTLCEIKVAGINSLNLNGRIFSAAFLTDVGLLTTIVLLGKQSKI